MLCYVVFSLFMISKRTQLIFAVQREGENFALAMAYKKKKKSVS